MLSDYMTTKVEGGNNGKDPVFHSTDLIVFIFIFIHFEYSLGLSLLNHNPRLNNCQHVS